MYVCWHVDVCVCVCRKLTDVQWRGRECRRSRRIIWQRWHHRCPADSTHSHTLCWVYVVPLGLTEGREENIIINKEEGTFSLLKDKVIICEEKMNKYEHYALWKRQLTQVMISYRWLNLNFSLFKILLSRIIFIRLLNWFLIWHSIYFPVKDDKKQIWKLNYMMATISDIFAYFRSQTNVKLGKIKKKANRIFFFFFT